MKIEVKNVTVPQKGNVVLYTLTNESGASVQLSNLGAGIISIIVPDLKGKMDDVTFGFDNIENYFNDDFCVGRTPGRYANRIANGHFVIDVNPYNLAINCGQCALHGGPRGFHNLLWNSEIDSNSVKFSLVSPDGDEGYPGTLNVSVTYTWNNDNKLIINYRATTDMPTVVNLTNHSYFNLSGKDSCNILNHKLRLNSRFYLPTDLNLIPLGIKESVEDTPMDFSIGKKIGRDIKSDFAAIKYNGGYDSCWIINKWSKDNLSKVAELTDELSGRILVVSSTQPAVQIYTGNGLCDSHNDKYGHKPCNHQGVAIECQGYPDAPNQPQFPTCILRPGEQYKETTVYSFTIIK